MVVDEANHHGAICKLDYGVRTMHRSAVVGVERRQEGTQHAALWNASFQYGG